MKINSQFMVQRPKQATSALLLLALSASLSLPIHADDDKKLKWESLPTGEIKETILLNQALTDEEKVIALTKQLDKRITLAPLTPLDILNTTDYEKRKMQPGNHYAWFIDMMVEDGDWRKGFPKARPQAVASTLAMLDAFPGVKNKQAVRSLLYVALALAGGDAPQAPLLQMLNDPTTPPQITYRILGGMLGSDRPAVWGVPGLVSVEDRPANIPLLALPRLLELTQHPWSYLGGSDVIVDDKPRKRIYPIRELAYACLLQLGVQAQKITVPATGKNEDGDPQNFVTRIQVDQASANKKLRELERASAAKK